MKDINGIEIKIGDKVKSRQHPGGFLPPAPPVIGIVEMRNYRIVIRFRKNGYEFDSFIDLEGQINEIIS